MTNNKKILITLGDVGGIGPEVVIKALCSGKIGVSLDDICIVGNSEVFSKTARDLGLSMEGNVEIVDVPFDISTLKVGETSPEAGKHSLLALQKACELVKDNKARAIATAPVSKKSINMAGHHYTGQTEILKDFLGAGSLYKDVDSPFARSLKPSKRQKQPEMLFVSENLRVLLLTRHIKLADVAHNLSKESVLTSIVTLALSLKKDFGVENPKIALCGLNPHAGESGLFGMEEEYILMPVIKQLRDKYSITVEGPFPADTLWAKMAKPFFAGQKLEYDAYVACYHDQGLIPVKLLAMDTAVNTSINLPVIRTSPSHGTAYDIAGMNKANYMSMIEAIKLADALSSKYPAFAEV
jgi:4-hydroxythreonine-4-phosphate dehydrogenase